MARGPINRRSGLGDGDLPRRYRRRHDRTERTDLEEADHDYLLDVDDYWDPYYEATSLDYQLVRVWHDVATIGFGPAIELPGAVAAPGPIEPPAPIAPEAVVDTLFDHLQRVAALATLQDYVTSPEHVAALEHLRSQGRRWPGMRSWFDQRRGPGVVLVLLAPFWIRSIADWSPPDGSDLDAFGRSLIAHLLLRYPVHESLFRPWGSASFPSLKWVSWLVLLGQGASLRRAASRYGWQLSAGLAQRFVAAPADLDPLEALMWAEITRLGGSRVELDRLLQHPAYVLDPTAGPAESELAFEDDRRMDADDPRRHRRFWQDTVAWLVRHRGELTDETSDVILDWAMHRHTENVARDVPEPQRFSWQGRTPASTLEPAREYRQHLGAPWWFAVAATGGHQARSVTWSAHGWDWGDDASWAVRELTSGVQLADESAAMHHCVASYVFRCVQKRSAIFSVAFAGERRFTVELDPLTRRVVQARGKRNRACTAEELQVMARWLESLRHLPRA